MKLVVDLEDARAKLQVVMERTKDGRWLVYAVHSKEGRGATSRFQSEKVANQAWRGLERLAIAAGWRLRQVVGKPSSPAPMRADEYGRRLFRDARTGQYRPDLSSEAPPAVQVGPPIPPLGVTIPRALSVQRGPEKVSLPILGPTVAGARKLDEFDLDSLPSPGAES